MHCVVRLINLMRLRAQDCSKAAHDRHGHPPRKGALDDRYSDKLIAFLAALSKDAGKQVFLILDNLPMHHSKLLKAWLAERTH